jgi:glutamyl-tRNA reductase
LSFDERLQALTEADIVVSSTGSPTTVLHKSEIAGVLAARANRPLVLVDIAVPRDIAPDVEELDNVYLYNIDHLEAIVRENSWMREQELSKCNEIIARRAGALMLKLNPPPVVRPVANVELVPGWSLCEAAI